MHPWVGAGLEDRDRILEKIAADREEFGDWIVFPDDAPPTIA